MRDRQPENGWSLNGNVFSGCLGIETMDVFELACGGMQMSRQPLRVLLSEDPLPLMQNCCFVELELGQLTLALDEGSRMVRLPNGLEAVFLDTRNDLLTLWLTPDAQRESGVWLNAQQSERIGAVIRAFAAA